jgi:hypothetical protein
MKKNELVSKPPLALKSGVGASCPILKILNVFQRLVNSSASALNVIETFETTSRVYGCRPT